MKKALVVLICLGLIGGCCKFDIPKAQDKVQMALGGIQASYITFVNVADKTGDPRIFNYLQIADQALAMLGPVLKALQDRICVPQQIVDAAIAKAAKAEVAKP